MMTTATTNMTRDEYYVLVWTADSSCVCEGPFESPKQAWMHEYADSVLVAHRSDISRLIMARKDGKRAFIMRGDLLAEDIQFSENSYEVTPVSDVKFPEFLEG